MDFTKQKDSQNFPRLLWGILQSIPFLCLVGIPLFICNIFQFSALILVYPFSRHAYRWVNYYIANFWWSSLVLWGRHVMRMRIVRSGDSLPMGKSAIVFCNHVEQPDIPVLLDLAYSHGSLGGVKFFVKNPLKWVPGLGWGMQMLNYLFVKRAWNEDANFVRKIFQRLVEYRSPIWLMSYPEGTRIKPHKLKRSQDFAKTRGYPHLNNVMLPRSKGFVTTMEQMRGRVDGVYDLTIGYPQGIPSLGQYIRGTVPEVHLHVRRFPIAMLPTDAKALEKWLLDRYVEKDRLLDIFFKTHRFT